MTVCNMSIEAGAKAGLVAPDDTTFAYLAGRRHARRAAWEQALDDWRTLRTDDGATWDREVTLDATTCGRTSRGGRTPARSTTIDGAVPDPDDYADADRARPCRRALEYMGLSAGHADPRHRRRHGVHRVVHEQPDRGPARRRRGARRPARHRVKRVMVVPGSHAVKAQAEAEGLDRIFRAAGADWREPGCSMCLAMNPDKLAPGERSASTSNRNFEGRQGSGGRTHLVSPAVAAATAVAGHFATPEDLSMRSRALTGDLRDRRCRCKRRRRHRPDHPRRVAEAGRAHRLREGPVRGVARRPRLRAQRRARFSRRQRSSSPVRRSASARPASTPCGRSSSTASTPWSPPSFSDIFRNNCTKNGLVPVVLARRPSSGSGTRSTPIRRLEIIVDVERLVVEVPAIGLAGAVPARPSDRRRFLEGLDDIGITLAHAAEIAAYEARAAWRGCRP